MSHPSSRTTAAIAVTSVLLTVCVLGSGVAVAASPAPAASGAPSWAYGTLKTVSFHGTVGAYAYLGDATFGLSVVFNETRNATDGQVTVNVVRTIGALIDAKYCKPDCIRPTAEANFTYHAWETSDAWANLTTKGVVNETLGQVPALALENSSVSATAKLRESAESVSMGTVLREFSLAVNVTGGVQITLTPALGLLPQNLSIGDTWTSVSAYTASGSASWQTYLTSWGKNVLSPYNGSSHGTESVAHAGVVSVVGSYLAGSDFLFGGASYPAVNLTLAGPFSLQEGVILFPIVADLFANGQPWSSSQHGSTVLTTMRLDVHAGKFYRGRLPIVASGYGVTNSTANVATAVGGGTMAPAASPSASASNSTFVQGQPESVATAQSDQNCLVNAVGCGLPGAPQIPVRLIVAAGVGVVAVAAVSATLLARRRPPRPVYPNSALYPPGAAGTGTPRPAPAPPPTEDDPLGHLW